MNRLCLNNLVIKNNNEKLTILVKVQIERQKRVGVCVEVGGGNTDILVHLYQEVGMGGEAVRRLGGELKIPLQYPIQSENSTN